MTTTLTLKQAAIIRNAAEELDHSIYEQYSGRGMYGSKCFGININRHGTGGEFYLGSVITQALIDAGEENILQEFERSSGDSLGLNSIVYFPRLQWPEEDEDEDEDEEE